MRAYHEATKHRLNGYAPAPGFLDWDSQPDPFRRWKGAPIIDLPLVEDSARRSYDDLYRVELGDSDPLTLGSLSLFLEKAWGLSGWKSLGPDRWSMRHNPSSGNLHPTECYLLLWQVGETGLEPGLYHYAPEQHLLERRARLTPEAARAATAKAPGAFGAIGLSTVTWREEWKYGARAYRYCQLDVGHALGAAGFSALTRGWRLACDPTLSDACVSALLGLDRAFTRSEAEPEAPDLMALFGPDPTGRIDGAALAESLTDWRGEPSSLSEECVRWPQVVQAHAAGLKSETRARPFDVPGPHPLSRADRSGLAATDLISQRRSAQRMDPEGRIGLDDFKRILARLLPSTSGPFGLWPHPPALHPVLFVHGVEGLDPGLYLLLRDGDQYPRLRMGMIRGRFAWQPIEDLPLFRLKAPWDLRKTANKLCCNQGISGRGAFSMGLVADLSLIEAEGAATWRRLHWEAGLIGQVLYLEAESVALSGTGIGCFFDDEVNRTFGLETGPEAPWGVVYHFTVGLAKVDKRLVSEPAYGDRRWIREAR